VPYPFVFLPAAYLHLAGETLAAAGVLHVVCFQQDADVWDSAVYAFTKHFYMSIVLGKTVMEFLMMGVKCMG